VFCQARKELSPNEVLNKGLNSESYFVYSLSVHARHTISFAEAMIEEGHQKQANTPAKAFFTIMNSFREPFTVTAMAEQSYRSFVLRSFLSVLIAFYVGFWFLDYNPSAASTVSLLLSDTVGSKLQKNIGRITGVVIGNIVPHILQQMMGQSCNPVRISLQGLALFSWVFMTFTIYMTSPEYGYITCLAAAFGGMGLTYPCDDNETSSGEIPFAINAYKTIVQTTIGAIILLIVDMFLSPARASALATQKLIRAMSNLDAGFRATFEKKNPDGTLESGPLQRRHSLDLLTWHGMSETIPAQERKPGTILRQLYLSDQLGNEASHEGRLYRDAWPKGLFLHLVKTCMTLRAYLHQLEKLQTSSKNVFDNVFFKLHEMEHFDKVKNGLLMRMDAAIEAAHTVLANIEAGYEEENAHLDSVSQLEELVKGQRNAARSMLHLPNLMKEINAKVTFSSEIPDTLEDEETCRVAVLFQILDAITDQMAMIIDDCIRMI